MQGRLVTRNAFGNLIIKTVSIEHHQLLAAKVYFTLELFYDDEVMTVWNSKYSVKSVEIYDSLITGMGRIRISLYHMM